MKVEIPTYSLKDMLPAEEDLPYVSVLTITRDRRQFFGLAKHSFLCQAYPAEKIEWVIVDDGKDAIKDLITDLPYVKYRLVDEPMTIGAKRNLAAEIATHDILIHMDDDDVYPNHSILTRVAMMLMSPQKSCVFSSTIPCYAIMEHKSFMNVPPLTLPWSQRVSEATMGYTRDFWKSRPFDSVSVAEADTFIRDREEACRELSPQDIIVSLCHPKQSTSRKAPEMKEPNGCHYGFSEELFTLIEEIRLSL
jgi:glycosyltransferase involved in cell wall biosynthesis